MPNGNEIGKYYIQIVPTTEGISGQIQTELEKGGSGAEKAGQSIGSKMASGFGTAIKAIGTAVVAATTAAVGATAKLIKETAAYGDTIDKASQKIGISAEAYQEWDFIAQHAGTSMASLTQGFKTLQLAAANGSDAFQALGISAEAVSQMSTEQLFGAVIQGLQDMDEGAERTALSNALLGRSTMELGALLNMSSEETAAMVEQVHALGGVMSDTAVKNAAAFQDSLQNMKTAFSGVKNTFAAEFLPAVTEGMDGLAALFSGDPLGAEKLQAGIETFANNMMTEFPKLIDAIVPAIDGIFNAIVASLPKFLEIGNKVIKVLLGQLPNVVKAIVDALPAMIPTLINGFVTIVQTMVENLQPILDPILSALPEIITTVLNTIVEAFPLLLDVLSQAVTTIVSYLPTMIQTIAEALPVIIPELVSGVVSMVVTLMNYLPAIIDPIIKALPTIITSITDALIQNLPLLIQGLLNLVVQLVIKIPEILKGLWDAITSNIKEKFADLGIVLSGLWGAVQKIFKAALNGIIWVLNGMIDGINVILTPLRAVIYAVGSLFGANWTMDDVAIPHIPQLAKGGWLQEGMAIVGEAGPELLSVYGGKTKVTPLSSQDNELNVGGVTINVYAAEGQDVRSIAEAVSDELARQFRQQQAVFA